MKHIEKIDGKQISFSNELLSCLLELSGLIKERTCNEIDFVKSFFDKKGFSQIDIDEIIFYFFSGERDPIYDIKPSDLFVISKTGRNKVLIK